MKITHWSFRPNSTDAVNHGGVTEDEAIGIFQQFVSNLKEDYETIEEDMASTIFGFSREDGASLNFEIFGKNSADVTYEVDSIVFKFLLTFTKTEEFKKNIQPQKLCFEVISMFFNASPEEFRHHLRSEEFKVERTYDWKFFVIGFALLYFALRSWGLV